MLEHQLLRGPAILVLRPDGRLTAEDFERVAAEVDPFLETRGGLAGILVHTRTFPGYRNLAALRAHLRFLRAHRHAVRRIAIVTDGAVLSRMPALVDRLIPPQVRRFRFDQEPAARAWLEQAVPVSGDLPGTSP